MQRPLSRTNTAAAKRVFVCECVPRGRDKTQQHSHHHHHHHHRHDRTRTSLKSMSIFESPSGSKPMSPAMLPSKFSGCGIKGIDLLLAMLRELDGVRTAWCMGTGVMKAEAPPMRAAKEAKVVFMVLLWCGEVLEKCGWGVGYTGC